MTILVSIVSEQTLPNYLFIKEFQSNIDKYVFISSDQMELKNKTETICYVSGIEKNERIKVIVSESHLHEVNEILGKINLPDDAFYYVNLTGGTKMMSLAVWRYFQKYQNVRFFYVPIQLNAYVEVFDDKPTVTTSFTYKTSVAEYLVNYGIRFETTPLLFDENIAFDMFNNIKFSGYKLNNFPKINIKKKNIPFNVQQIHTKWFEEFCYYRIKRELNLKENEILTGIKIFDIKQEKEIKNYQNDNEIDVIFIYNNKPYIVECKYKVGDKKINTITLNQIIYKLSSINKRFGLSARSTIFTLSDLNSLFDNAKENLKRRCELAGVYYPITDVNLINNEKFNIFLNQFLT